jgi:Fe2+ or Zn2+ uptake regulation protein
MSNEAPLLKSEILEILKVKKAAQFEDLLREVRKSYPDTSEKDLMSTLIKFEIMGLIVTTRLSKKDIRVELLGTGGAGTD